MLVLEWEWYNRYPTEENRQKVLLELERYKDEQRISVDTYNQLKDYFEGEKC